MWIHNPDPSNFKNNNPDPETQKISCNNERICFGLKSLQFNVYAIFFIRIENGQITRYKLQERIGNAMVLILYGNLE